MIYDLYIICSRLSRILCSPFLFRHQDITCHSFCCDSSFDPTLFLVSPSLVYKAKKRQNHSVASLAQNVDVRSVNHGHFSFIFWTQARACTQGGVPSNTNHANAIKSWICLCRSQRRRSDSCDEERDEEDKWYARGDNLCPSIARSNSLHRDIGDEQGIYSWQFIFRREEAPRGRWKVILPQSTQAGLEKTQPMPM